MFKTVRWCEEVLSLIRRVVAAPGVGIEAFTPSAITLEMLTGGRSAAQVFKLTPLFGAGNRATKGTPVVVKIAPRADALRERANYQRFVRVGLPAACRAALLGFVGGGSERRCVMPSSAGVMGRGGRR